MISMMEVLNINMWLPYPCPLEAYLDESFLNARENHFQSDNVPQHLPPHFWVVPARNYLKYFFSDRMHMFKNQKWMATHPEYKLIMNGISFAEDCDHDGCRGEGKNNNASNLDMYISSFKYVGESDERRGTVYSLVQLRDMFSGNKYTS